MDRRSFVAQVFTGLAAIPLVGKLIKAQQPKPSPRHGFTYSPQDGVRNFINGAEVLPKDGYYYVTTLRRTPRA